MRMMRLRFWAGEMGKGMVVVFGGFGGSQRVRGLSDGLS